jgi:UDP-N-acetylmuramoylalanine--D-glutamate ligase
MDELAGKRLVILGLARQGKAFARFAVEAGALVTVSDLRGPEMLAESMDELSDLKIDYVLGEHPMDLLAKADVLAISGGVPANAPIVTSARKIGMEVTNDSQEFIKRSPAAVIGVTGSAGKTTTTALTGVMGQVGGKRTWIGGNIGRPLIADLNKMDPEDMVVQELSSFQLEVWTQSPPIAAILNITPNHLDRHKTMSAYVSAKANILRHQAPDGIAVLSADDPGALALRPLVQGRLRLFSLKQEVEDGAFVRAGQIWLRNGGKTRKETAVCLLSRIKLRGEHNLLNVLAAVTLADSAGVSAEAIEEAIDSFLGVEHRLELVSTIDGVQYVNDSIATAPERALAAIESFDEPIVLLAGGKDKEMKWEEWADGVNERVKHVILFGELAEKLADALRDRAVLESGRKPSLSVVKTLEEAVAAASAVAEWGDVVLLSPGGTSFDAFEDFVERGEMFRRLILGLSERIGNGGVANKDIANRNGAKTTKRRSV